MSNPTVRPHQPFNPSEDAQKLQKAMKGIGTDEKALIEVLCQRTARQRQEIAKAFKSEHGKDLIKRIESETSKEFENILVALLKTPGEMEAENLRDSVSGMGTNEDTLIEIVCTKINAEMIDIKNAYKKLYGKNMESDIKGDVSGSFENILVSLMTANRQENQSPDHNKAFEQAKMLYKAGEGRLGTNESLFNKIYATESYAQLRLIFDEYQKLAHHPIENAIKSEMSTNVERAFLTLTQFARSPADFYAQRLHEAMSGMGTRDKQLIRICVLRCEIDMQDIKNEFHRRYGRTLESWIRADTSGDYQKALLCLIGDPKWN